MKYWNGFGLQQSLIRSVQHSFALKCSRASCHVNFTPVRMLNCWMSAHSRYLLELKPNLCCCGGSFKIMKEKKSLNEMSFAARSCYLEKLLLCLYLLHGINPKKHYSFTAVFNLRY